MEKGPKFVPARYVKDKYAVSTAFLRKCGEEGKIGVIRTPGGKRLYNIGDIAKLFGDTKPNKRDRVAYARVSSESQRADLERQEGDLRAQFPDHRIISDVGSGLNWKRKGFNEILDLCFSGDIEEVAIARKDRLCRFGYELLETVFTKLNVRLVVLHESAGDPDDDTRELSDDLLSIVTVFVARNNGKRAAENRRFRKRLEAQNSQNKALSELGTESEA